jgi:signal transduction histidine kinase
MIKMKNILKQSAEWVTKCKRKPFLLARLKLAAAYTLTTLAILALFNIVVLDVFVKDLPVELETFATEQAESALENALMIGNILILVVVAFVSYLLAGFALKPIEKSYKQQKKFVADAAHELRTPLAVMKTGAEAHIANVSEKEREKFIGDSIEEIDHLSTMVDDLLVLSKSDNLQKPAFEKVNLSKLANKLTQHMQVHAKQKNITLKTEIENACNISGNAAYLKRLLANLIQNAIDYNKPNGEVKVSLKKHGKKVELKVSDTGVGIGEQDLPHIFNRFYKADKARTGSSGAGLGLSIVKEITEMHGGKIAIESELEKNTIVTISFPCG